MWSIAQVRAAAGLGTESVRKALVAGVLPGRQDVRGQWFVRRVDAERWVEERRLRRVQSKLRRTGQGPVPVSSEQRDATPDFELLAAERASQLERVAAAVADLNDLDMERRRLEVRAAELKADEARWEQRRLEVLARLQSASAERTSDVFAAELFPRR
jgi:hypothetical protein